MVCVTLSQLWVGKTFRAVALESWGLTDSSGSFYDHKAWKFMKNVQLLRTMLTESEFEFAQDIQAIPVCKKWPEIMANSVLDLFLTHSKIWKSVYRTLQCWPWHYNVWSLKVNKPSAEFSSGSWPLFWKNKASIMISLESNVCTS